MLVDLILNTMVPLVAAQADEGSVRCGSTVLCAGTQVDKQSLSGTLLLS